MQTVRTDQSECAQCERLKAVNADLLAELQECRALLAYTRGRIMNSLPDLDIRIASRLDSMRAALAKVEGA